MKRDIKGAFKSENPIKFKLKEMFRDFMQNKMFYATHSKFATYIDPEYLNIFETELVSFTPAFYREFGKNMDPERNPGKEGHSNTRGLHSLDVAELGKDIGYELLLNEGLLRVGGLIHDLGHFGFAHDAEKIISNYLKGIGVADVHHSAVARLAEESERIHERTLERLQKTRGKNFTKKELEEYERYKYIILDIALAHNGESEEYEIISNEYKTVEQMKEENIKAFTENGIGKKIISTSTEGRLIRLLDLISYVAKDFKGGVISKFIDVNDKDFEKIFIDMGIPKETLDKWATEPEKKDKIVRAVTYILRDNLKQNSKGTNGAIMSKRMADLMHNLRDLNYKKVVGPRTRKIMDILPERIPQLIDKYSKILMEYRKTGKKDEEINTFRTGMRKNIIRKQSTELEEIYREIIARGTESFVRREVDEIINNSNSETITNRRKRLETDIEALKADGEITEETKEGYIARILKEINLTPEESEDMLRKRIRLQYPEASSKEFEELLKQNRHLRLETFEECLDKIRVAMYVGGSSNDYLLDMLEEEGLLTEEERKTRYQYGGDQSKSSLGETMAGQAKERAEMNRNSDDGRGK